MDYASRRQFIHQAGALTGGVFAGGLTPAAAAASAQQASSAPMSKTKKLRALLQKPGVQLVPEAYSVRTAGIAESAGFEAVYTGGNMMSGMHLGLQDWGLITMSEMVEISSRIADAISIPVISDADQGGETALNVYRTVKMFEKAGIAGIHIEDSINPKHMGGASDRLQPADEMLTRISAAVEARTDPDFVIIARTDELYNDGSVDEAIRRGVAYAKAGADVFMCLSLGA